MALKDFFESDLEAIQDDLPTTFTFGATNYTGTLSETSEDDALLDAGILSEFSNKLTVLLSEFGATTPPTIGSKIVIGPKSYTIRAIRRFADEKSVEYALNLRRSTP